MIIKYLVLFNFIFLKKSFFNEKSLFTIQYYKVHHLYLILTNQKNKLIINKNILLTQNKLFFYNSSQCLFIYLLQNTSLSFIFTIYTYIYIKKYLTRIYNTLMCISTIPNIKILYLDDNFVHLLDYYNLVFLKNKYIEFLFFQNLDFKSINIAINFSKRKNISLGRLGDSCYLVNLFYNNYLSRLFTLNLMFNVNNF